jgi:hypothetical protein
LILSSNCLIQFASERQWVKKISAPSEANLLQIAAPIPFS